ncbi:MAG: hypothetical protein GY796_04395 [Chloroflexi bacterium]|nr:hypothetical protein [Chloroflexota bacterium]
MSPEQSATPQDNSSKILVILGIIWLFSATVLLASQLLDSPEIKVEWETATELNTAGFHLYRSASPNGEFNLITDELIPATGSSVSGGAYSFVDENVNTGETYYYLLEEVEFDSTTNQYKDDIISSNPAPRVEWWVIILIAAVIIMGIALIVTGLRERR